MRGVSGTNAGNALVGGEMMGEVVGRGARGKRRDPRVVPPLLIHFLEFAIKRSCSAAIVATESERPSDYWQGKSPHLRPSVGQVEREPTDNWHPVMCSLDRQIHRAVGEQLVERIRHCSMDQIVRTVSGDAQGRVQAFL